MSPSAPTRCATGPDGVRLAYDVCGTGPALVLLPGHSDDRRVWHAAGYVHHLRDHCTVICLDPRGQGESDRPRDPAAYALERVLADVCAVADACGRERFAVWGYSFGGTVALQLAARCPRVTRAVAGGCHFGRIYDEALVARSAAQAWAVADAKDAGRLDELPLTPQQRAVAERIDIPAHIACLRALPGWPVVEPGDLRCPTYVYAGADDALVAPELEPRRGAIEAAGSVLHLIPGLDHATAFSAAAAVVPPVLAFLPGTAV